MKIAFTIIGILLILIAWFGLDFSLGRKKHCSKPQKKNFPIRESHLQIFTYGPDLFTDLFGEIRKATRHIHILLYIVKVDGFSTEFLELLTEKAKEGVEVRLLVDWVGSMKISRKTVRDLRNSGLKFAFSHVPKPPFLFYSSQVRNHRKITIIDGKIGYMGGYNVGKEYINQDTKLSPWRDYHVKVTGEGVQDLQTEFLDDWQAAAKIKVAHNEVYYPKLEKGPVKHRFIPTEGVFLEETFSELIKTAKSSIMIGTPYFIPSQQIFEDLLQALKNGVQLTVLVPYTTDHILVQEASYRYLRRLLREGASVYQYLKGFYHAKVIMIDDLVCDIGTANFDRRSMFLNYELNCLIYDQNVIKELKTILIKDFHNSKKLGQHDLCKPNLQRTLKELAARSIAAFL